MSCRRASRGACAPESERAENRSSERAADFAAAARLDTTAMLHTVKAQARNRLSNLCFIGQTASFIF